MSTSSLSFYLDSGCGHIGMHNEGYWTGFHMALQFEDVVDCWNGMHPEFEYLFLFDHSQGHARKRDGALDGRKMRKGFGRSQPKVRDTEIKAVKGFFWDPIPVAKRSAMSNPWSSKQPIRARGI